MFIELKIVLHFFQIDFNARIEYELCSTYRCGCQIFNINYFSHLSPRKYNLLARTENIFIKKIEIQI